MISSRQRGPCTVFSSLPSNSSASDQRRRSSRFSGVQGRACAPPVRGARCAQQLVQSGAILDRLHHQLQRAAAGQAETIGLFLGHAIGRALAAWSQASLCRARVYQVVLDAAARHRSDTWPSARNASIAPGGRGLEPKVCTTVASQQVACSACQACKVFNTERSTLSTCFSKIPQVIMPWTNPGLT